MVIKIKHPQVLNNLTRFRNSLFEMKEQLGSEEQRDYWVLFHRKTGDMRFLQKLASLEPYFADTKKGKSLASDWVELHLIIEPRGEVPSFSVCSEDKEKVKDGELDDLAKAILFEMLQALNQRLHEIQLSSSALPEETALQDLNEFQLEVGSKNFSPEKFAPWLEKVSREQAEEVLKEQSVGTYLFRECIEISDWIVQELGRANREEIFGYLLTFVNRGERISERLVLRTKKGWALYNGEVELSERFYFFFQSLNALLNEVY